MAKRIIDGERVWGSSRLARCREEFIPEYTWLYCLADGNSNFELDLRVIHGKVAAIRPNFTVDVLRRVLDEFHKHGLLFTWKARNKTYAHWTGSDKKGLRPPIYDRTKGKAFVLPGVQTPEFEIDWPELQQYLADVDAAEAAAAAGETGLFPDPLPAPLPTAAEIREEAEHNASEATRKAEANGEASTVLKFELFWNLYPDKRDKNEAWLKFKRLQPTDWDTLIGAIEAWEASPHWQDPKFIPKAVTFITSENWRHEPPKEKPNGKPDPNTRTERNLAAAGLAHTKVDRRAG